jgi:hypothetical protein
MYVKITAGERHGDVIFETSGAVNYDTIAAKLGGNATETSIGDVDFGEAVGVTFNELSVLEIDRSQTRYEEGKGIFVFRYAWWVDDRRGFVGVVTTRNIFIVGDNGKTIDRVH